MSGWTEALRVDPRRRDREGVLAAALRPVLGLTPPPDLDALADPNLRRRAGYLLDLAQHLRGQTSAEAARLARLREALGPLEFGRSGPASATCRRAPTRSRSVGATRGASIWPGCGRR